MHHTDNLSRAEPVQNRLLNAEENETDETDETDDDDEGEEDEADEEDRLFVGDGNRIVVARQDEARPIQAREQRSRVYCWRSEARR